MNKYFEKLYKQKISDFYELVLKNMELSKKMFIVTANPETFIWAERDKEVQKLLLAKETMVIADGISLVRAARILKYKVKERITGIDLAEYLLKEANNLGYKVAFLGATPEVQTKLKTKLAQDYPHLKVVGAADGYETDRDSFLESLVKKEPDLVLVALGIPEQEKLIYRHLPKFKKGIFIGVGGSLDVISGVKKRAPKLIIKMRLEWLYRLICEPKRFKRFYQNNIKFMFKVLKLHFTKKN